MSAGLPVELLFSYHLELGGQTKAEKSLQNHCLGTMGFVFHDAVTDPLPCFIMEMLSEPYQ
ncbi:hypothetical protein N7507_002777 [Penicillium longicatenatum]|nr:hypothetical protein N7507_002777 [Penicillium longicatenatum]